MTLTIIRCQPSPAVRGVILDPTHQKTKGAKPLPTPQTRKQELVAFLAEMEAEWNAYDAELHRKAQQLDLAVAEHHHRSALMSFKRCKNVASAQKAQARLTSAAVALEAARKAMAEGVPPTVMARALNDGAIEMPEDARPEWKVTAVQSGDDARSVQFSLYDRHGVLVLETTVVGCNRELQLTVALMLDDLCETLSEVPS